MRELKVYRNSEGVKLYPVCSWEKNQHKLYNAHDRAWIWVHDTESDEAYAELERVEQAMEAFESHVIHGIVYATYKDGQLIKDFIAGYDARH